VVDASGEAASMRPRPGFSSDSTRRTLAEACQAAGLDPSGAELLRLGENAIWRLHSVPIVARIARTIDYLPDIEAEVAVARWLESVGFPAVRLAGPADQPIVVDRRIVTFWELLSVPTRFGTVAELGSLLRQLHDLEPPTSLALPELDPFRRTQTRIAQADLAGEDRDFLRGRLAELRARYASLVFTLPPGPVHGDASIGNIIRRRDDDTAVLTDLDGFATGPREWDLVRTAMYYERLGWHTAEEYVQFVGVYGFDVMGWLGYPVMRDIRETLMVTWLAQNTQESPRIAAEVTKRIADLRSGDGRRDWAPY